MSGDVGNVFHVFFFAICIFSWVKCFLSSAHFLLITVLFVLILLHFDILIYLKYELLVRYVVWEYFLPLFILSLDHFSRVFHRTKYLIQMKSLISTALSSHSLINFSVSSNLLLILSSVSFFLLLYSCYCILQFGSFIFFSLLILSLCSFIFLLISLILMIMINSLNSLP